MLKNVPSLRTKRFLRAFQRSLREVRAREDFRLVAYSVQSNHVHMIVEASDNDALGRGISNTEGWVLSPYQPLPPLPRRPLPGLYP